MCPSTCLIVSGTVSKQAYNHYALLRSIEDLFGLDHLGYAAQDGLRAFEVIDNNGYVLCFGRPREV